MSAAANKKLMQSIFDALAIGDGRPFNEAMAEDFTWVMIGSNSWSGTYRGRDAVRRDLLKPLMKEFATRYTNTAQRIVAEGDMVVVECRGDVVTKSGKPYNNRYCWVCRLRDGQLVELVEYMDTQLVADTLGPRPKVSAAG